MEEKNKTIKLLPGALLPLGGSTAGKYYNFAAFFPQASECKLHIYQKDKQEATVILSLFAHSDCPGIYTGKLLKTQLQELGDWGYLLEADGSLQMDPYAKKTLGRESFGMGGRVLSAIEEATFDWRGEHRLHRTYQDMILYKLHVRGFTMTAPGVRHKGTYLGLMEKSDYLTELGINAVLLFPCVEFDEGLPKGRVNYWGYAKENCYFAPKAAYAANPQEAATEFKQMVKHLHAKGIEVLMEMHFTPELRPEFILECLLWWIREYHIDGFRMNRAFIPEKLLAQHPYLAGTKLITEGFDVNQIYDRKRPNYINLGECDMSFAENLRRFIKGDAGMTGRVAGYLERQTGMQGVLNYITDHNGFTLADLYAYGEKHNEANGEENRDGTNCNFSWNCGVEGRTQKKQVKKLRMQLRKNAMAFLMLSQGTPLLLAGDEFGNSQQGNNNAYCQDNETGWVSWKEFRTEKELYEFTKMLIKLRKEHPVWHNTASLKGIDTLSCGYPDSSRHGTRAWYPDYADDSRTLGWLLCGNYATVRDGAADCSFYLAANMHWEPQEFELPLMGKNEQLRVLFATDADCMTTVQGRTFLVPARSLVVFVSESVGANAGKRTGGRRKPKNRI
ncbi:MAG: hypothetical protein IJY09_00185 [Lachnospiraceae bacterium]|nr:hypothetical protein [Lachnospiraceae bacterium]